MSSINKLEKFRQNEGFKCLLQPKMEELFRVDYPLKGKWNSDFFKNNNPITLELGCGKGEYTIALAELHPERNFIGIDIKGARLWKGAKYAETKGLNNVAFVRTNIDFIEWLFGKDEIEEIWVTFPDPQLKSPRKRLTGSMFLERYRKFLAPGGVIQLKTDSKYLHEYTAALAAQNGLHIICNSSDIYGATETAGFPQELLTVQTFYEKNYLSWGLPITFLKFNLLQANGKKYEAPFKEPEWDQEYWRKEEDKGRLNRPIR
ncbi:MAG: tRNA (guanosine(46)-N7)-methyltransferase TrmB [Candidatus Egerieousia sp.]